MIFWTLVFITYYLCAIVKNGVFKSFGYDLVLMSIEQAKGNISEDKKTEMGLKSCLFLLVYGGLFIAEIIYLINAISIDIYKYPTLFMIVFLILGLAFNRTPKNDLTTEEGRIRYKISIEKTQKFSLKSLFIRIMWLIYFGYMFWVIVF